MILEEMEKLMGQALQHQQQTRRAVEKLLVFTYSGREGAMQELNKRLQKRFSVPTYSTNHLPDPSRGHACSQVYFRRSREMGQRTSICRLLSDSQGGLRNALLSS